MADVQLGPEEITAVSRVLQSGWLSQGPRVQEFEAEFARFLGVEQAYAVASGTAALHLACLVLGLGSGDEVLCPALTFVATANAILYTGASPVFVDIRGLDDLNISPEDAARKVTERTRALMVVHYGGYVADMEALQALAREQRLAVIEDCAHAPGAVHPSAAGPKMAGTLGEIGCFSFFANKNLTTGEGGLVATNSPELAERLRTARSHGMTTLTWDRHRGHSFSYDVVAPGYNYRMDEVRAALGLEQLKRLGQFNARRREFTRLYRDELQGLPGVGLPFTGRLENSACHLFPLLLPEEADRDGFMAALAARGIQTSLHYPPVHRFSYYRTLWPAGYDHRVPGTEAASARLITLPLFPGMTPEQFQLVVASVKECWPHN